MQKKISPVLFLLTALFCFLPLSFSAGAATVRTPAADGTVTYKNGTATVDASHAADGYLMIRYLGGAPKIKVRIKKDIEYTYDLNTGGVYETFPLTEGSGSYSVRVFENTSGSQYIQSLSETVSVTLSDENSPFLYPNQFCNFNANSAVVATADAVTAGITDDLKKVETVYTYVMDHIQYDTQKAATVQSGYLPDVDATLKSGTGICFDYAAVMTSMLRLENVPTKLVIGYSQDVYHAWVSVYIKEQGWIDNLIYFDGSTWRFMDPTFASNGKGNAAVQSYVADPGNYSAKFTY